jgi:hypothetical protein
MSLADEQDLCRFCVPDGGVGVFQDLVVLDLEQLGAVAFGFQLGLGARLHAPGQLAQLSRGSILTSACRGRAGCGTEQDHPGNAFESHWDINLDSL